MRAPQQRPIHLGGGLMSWPPDYDAERRSVRENIARKRIEIAELEVRLAELEAAEARRTLG